MKVKVAAAAPVTPPETGASMYAILCFLADWLRAMATVGDIVLLSIMSEPGAALIKRPI